MAQSHEAVEIDQKELENAQNMWDVFATVSKWSCVAIAGLLVVLGLSLIDWT